MKRRYYVASLGSVILSGCAGESTNECENSNDPCATITHSPNKPTIGQPTVFDASNSVLPEGFTGKGTTYYFWRTGSNTQTSLPNNAEYAGEGPKFTHRFDTPGRHIVEVFVTDGTNVVFSDEKYPNTGVGIEEPDGVARSSEVVQVKDLEEQPIDLKESNVNISFKGTRKAVPINESAVLTLSITNTIGSEDITAQLIIEVPSGLSVNESSFKQGGGQFTSTYDVPAGDTISDRLSLRADETGPYTLNAYVVYKSKANASNKQTDTGQITTRFYDE